MAIEAADHHWHESVGKKIVDIYQEAMESDSADLVYAIEMSRQRESKEWKDAYQKALDDFSSAPLSHLT
jgi:hypothetical protein